MKTDSSYFNQTEKNFFKCNKSHICSHCWTKLRINSKFIRQLGTNGIKKNLPNGLACIYTDFFFLFVKSSANLNLTVTYSTFKPIQFSHYSNFHFSNHFSSFFFHIIRGRQICIRKKSLDLHWIWQTMSNYAVLFHILNKIQLNSLAVTRIGSILRNRWPD